MAPCMFETFIYKGPTFCLFWLNLVEHCYFLLAHLLTHSLTHSLTCHHCGKVSSCTWVASLPPPCLPSTSTPSLPPPHPTTHPLSHSLTPYSTLYSPYALSTTPSSPAYGGYSFIPPTHSLHYSTPSPTHSSPPHSSM